MRIYSNLIEAYKEIERDLFEMGITIHPKSYQNKIIENDPNFETKELQGYCYKITSGSGILPDFQGLGGNLGYLLEEVKDRTCGEALNPGNAYKTRNEVWEQFLVNGKFDYTYAERFAPQLVKLVEELNSNPNTRQAILEVYNSHLDQKNWGGKARIPCSMHYQFFVREREGKKYLDVIYVMRSCDLYTHFIYDVALTILLRNWVADQIGYKYGYFCHFIGSLHIYRKDYDKRRIF